MNKLIMVAVTICVAVVTRAVEFPNPTAFNPTWESAKPGSSYSTDLPTAALLGNGSLGAVNGGDGNHKKFVLTRGDLWSCGDFTCGKKEHNIGPISFADLIIAPGLKTVSSTDTLDLPTATLVTEGKFGKGKVRLESYVAADEDLLVISGVSDTDDTWILRIVAHNQKKSFPVEAGISDDGFWVKRSTLNLLPKDDPRGWTTNATAAVSALGAEFSALSNVNGIEARANASIHANKPFAFIVSTNPPGASHGRNSSRSRRRTLHGGRSGGTAAASRRATRSSTASTTDRSICSARACGPASSRPVSTASG